MVGKHFYISTVLGTALLLAASSSALAQGVPTARQPYNSAISGRQTDYSVLMVNPLTGDDLYGKGTPVQPFRTITQALQVAQAGTIILLAPGRYTAESGETFPLQLPPGITLQGSPNAGESVMITGGGEFRSASLSQQNAAILAGDRAGVGYLVVSNPNGHGLWVEGGSPVIRSNTFVANRHTGLYVASGTPSIESNYFHQNDVAGLVLYGDSKAIVRNNLFQQTGTAITVASEAVPEIINNRVIDNEEGILLLGNAQPTLTNNDIQQNRRNGVVEVSAVGTPAVMPPGPVLTASTANPANFVPQNPLPQNPLPQNPLPQNPLTLTPVPPPRMASELASDPDSASAPTVAVNPAPTVRAAPVLAIPTASAPPDAVPVMATAPVLAVVIPAPVAAPVMAPVTGSPVVPTEEVTPSQPSESTEMSPSVSDTLPVLPSVSLPESSSLDSPALGTPEETITAVNLTTESTPAPVSIANLRARLQTSSPTSVTREVAADYEPTTEPPQADATPAATEDVAALPRLSLSTPLAAPEAVSATGDTPTPREVSQSSESLPTGRVSIADLQNRLAERQRGLSTLTPSPNEPPTADAVSSLEADTTKVEDSSATTQAAIEIPVIPAITHSPSAPQSAQVAPPPTTSEIASLPSLSGSGQRLPVPGVNIPIGSGGSGGAIAPALTSQFAPSLLPPNGSAPPAPPSRAAALGLHYRVFVEAPNESTQTLLRRLVPDAFRTQFEGRPLMQAGAYPDEVTAQERLQLLLDNGLEARIEHLP